MDDVTARRPTAAASPQTAEPAQSVTEHTLGWITSAKSRVGAVSDLAVAEAKLAAMSFALMVFFAVIAAVCVLGVAGLALAGVANLLISIGLPVWAVLLTLTVPLAIAVALLWSATKKASRHLEFAATREQLVKADSVAASEPEA